MLQLNNIKKSYNKIEVLSDISYTFRTGQIYPILGGNGAGRTTLFECICGDLAVDSGEIITKEKEHLFLAAKQSILPMYLTGFEFAQFLCTLKQDKSDPEYYLEKVGLDEKIRDTMICDYSFEDKKRLQLAAFLIQKPYVIMFDEPFDYCSEEYIIKFLSVLEEMKNDHIILISTGIFEIANQIAKDIIVINNGELNYIPEDTMQIPEIKKAVLDIIEEADNGNL